MGHGIKEYDRAAFALKPAWHRLGKVIDHAMSAEEALEYVNWQVLQEPAMYYDAKSEEYRVVDGTFINIRQDTGHALGVVGKRYEVIQNREAFDFLDGLRQDGAIEYESVFSIDDGKTVCVLARTPKDSTVAGEPHKQFILFKTSHDGSEAIRIVPTDVRVVCQNTMSLAVRRRGSDSVSIRHTRSARDRLRIAQEAMADVDRTFENYKQSAEMMATVKLTDNDFLTYVNSLVPEVDRKDSGRSYVISENKRRQLFMNYYHDARQNNSNYPNTLLAAFHATSQMADHWLPRNRNAEKRFTFTQTGGGNTLKQKAWQTALSMSERLGSDSTHQTVGGDDMTSLLAQPVRN